MAKDNTLLMIGIVVLGLMWFNQQGTSVTPPANDGSGGGSVNLCTVVEPSASFTGQRMYAEGTSLTTEYVRVIKDGSRLDLGQIIMNGGTLNTNPSATYNLYYGENSSTYYTLAEKYTAPCQDAVDDKIGVLCAIDRSPSITEYDENNLVMKNGSTNCQAIAASQSVDLSVKVKAAADKCYGNPDSAKTNIICFKYNTTAIQSVKSNVNSLAVPYSISNVYTNSAYGISCYELPLLKDLKQETLPVTITATSTEPVNSNITIILDDAAFDLDADTLEEIWDFVDEDNNALDAATVMGAICYT